MTSHSRVSHRFFPGLALAALALAAAPLKTTGEEKLRDSDHKKFGKAIAAYYDAKDKKKGIEAAFLKVSKDMTKAQKKLREVPLLSSVGDWERAMWYAQHATYKKRYKGGKVVMGKLNNYGAEIPAAYHLPPKYNVRTGKPYSLVLCIPDAGEKPDTHLETHWNDVALRENILLVAIDMPTDTAGWSVFSPDDKSGVWAVMKTYAAAKTNFGVDMNRVFIAGTGKGFAAAAATAASFPQCFAGIIGKGEIPEMSAKNFQNIPSLLLSDSEGAKAFEGATKEMGYGNTTLNAGGALSDVKTFVEEKERNSYPAEIVFSPYCDISTGTPWVSIEGFQVDLEKGIDERPLLKAKADRDSNTVTIDAKDISNVVIYLNDSLVDLAKPVKFVVNGNETEAPTARNPRMMLDLGFSSGDWGRVFTSRVRLAVE